MDLIRSTNMAFHICKSSPRGQGILLWPPVHYTMWGTDTNTHETNKQALTLPRGRWELNPGVLLCAEPSLQSPLPYLFIYLCIYLWSVSPWTRSLLIHLAWWSMSFRDPPVCAPPLPLPRHNTKLGLQACAATSVWVLGTWTWVLMLTWQGLWLTESFPQAPFLFYLIMQPRLLQTCYIAKDYLVLLILLSTNVIRGMYHHIPFNRTRDQTHDFMYARQAFYQVSYGLIPYTMVFFLINLLFGH